MYCDHERILTEYRDADFNRRLHMYLQTPELRSEFVEIDRREFQFKLPADTPGCNDSLAAKLSALFNRFRFVCGL